MYKDFQQAFKNIKGKDFSKYLEETFGKENVGRIIDELKKYQIDMEQFIK